MGLPGAGAALTPVRAALFDMDGVLRHWRGRGAAAGEQLAGLPPGAIGRIAFDIPEYAETQDGRATHLDWAGAIGRRLVAEFGPGADAAVEAWLDYRGDLDAEMVELVAAVRRSVPVVLVSNATDRLRADLAYHGLEEAFDAVVCSAEVGLVKPDREIYEYAAAAAGVPPAGCFFTDDLAVNVEGARAAGLQAVRFTGRAELVAAIRAAGVPLG